jgi:predicted N-acetyltransferase YhbS
MTAQSLSPSGVLYSAERPQDAAEAAALIDRAFGPGRFTKSSERVREFATYRPDLSFCAWRDGRLIGVVHQHIVRVGERTLVFLGPLAVDAAERKHGAGHGLVEHAIAAAQAAGYEAILLVGDAGFFQRCGFDAAPAARVVMPGPVDQARVLLRALKPGGADGVEGPVRAPVGPGA